MSNRLYRALSMVSCLAFLTFVLMAGPGIVGEELLYLQASAIRTASGVSDKDIAREHAIQEKIFRVIIEEQDRVEARKKIKEILFNMMAKSIERLDGAAREKALKGIEKNADAQLGQLMSPWLRFFLTYDPGPALMKIACPILPLTEKRICRFHPKKIWPASSGP